MPVVLHWSRFHVCTSFGLLTVVFGLGMGLHVCMRTTLEMMSYAMHENSFINQGEFVAMKILNGRRAPRCDKHQFCDKMTVST